DVYEVGEVDGVWFAAMELCRGGALASHPMPLPPRAVVDVGLQVCAALEYAHETLGLVHRDLKPQNLLLDGATVKVADLGIASAEGFPVDHGTISGTQGYMSREQRMGHEVDARSDVYALGVVLHVLATGSFPTNDETTPLDDDSTLEPGGELPMVLAPVLDRCLRPIPQERYGSMAELAAALQAVDAPGEALAALLSARVTVEDVVGERLPELIGRERELASLRERVASPGLVLLKGPGGVGKTRLAQALRHGAREAGRRTVWLDLAEVRDTAGLLRTVATALDTPLGRGDEDRRVEVAGQAFAARGPVLVVLDNLEQLPTAAAVIDRWRGLAPEATWVGTSRVPLQLAGEQLVELDVLDEDASVALLRARALERGVEIEDDAPLRRIATRLDGLPLALELAAGRIGVLSPQEVEERLSLSLLRSTRSDRSGTLAATLQWSWDLLDDDERAVLAQLSVFRGGFTLEQAEAVVRARDRERWVPELVGSLVDRSLVRVRDHGRYDLLVSVAEMAAARLLEHPAWASAVADRHARTFCSMDPEALGEKTRVPVEAARLQLDRDNFQAATERALATGKLELAAVGMQLLWLCAQRRGPFDEVLRLGKEALLRPDLTGRARSRVANVAGTAARFLGRYEEAQGLYDEAWSLAEAEGDEVSMAAYAGNLGLVRRELNDRDGARAWFEQALTRCRAVKDRAREVFTLIHLATEEMGDRRLPEAQARFEEALAVARSSGLRYPEAIVQGQFGILESRLGRREEAIARMEGALEVYRAFGDRLNVGLVLGNIGITIAKADPARALPYLEEALASHRALGHVRGEAIALGELGAIHDDLGHVEEAIAWHREALVLMRRLDDQEGIEFSEAALQKLTARPSTPSP
ncbi:MAG: tetratricopeptide repeat protein, partial [Alphaproteobacteria bacterium]|nr:tetratricopeptide repeat protein [Alphaproteobacteria bacterium]